MYLPSLVRSSSFLGLRSTSTGTSSTGGGKALLVGGGASRRGPGLVSPLTASSREGTADGAVSVAGAPNDSPSTLPLSSATANIDHTAIAAAPIPVSFPILPPGPSFRATTVRSIQEDFSRDEAHPCNPGAEIVLW